MTENNSANPPQTGEYRPTMPDLTEVRFRLSKLEGDSNESVQIRLKRSYSEILVNAFTEAKAHASRCGRSDYVARYQQLLRALPRHAPYIFTVYAKDWGFISFALRLGGQTPVAGSEHARARALYSTLSRQVPYRVK